MLELTVEKQLPVIYTNFDLVKISLTESIEKYKGLVVTAEGLKDAKADQLTLSKLETEIDNYRKEVKKEVEKPIKEFEANCKTLIGLIGEARIPLKESIKVFDDAERDKKKLIAEGFITEAITSNSLNGKYAIKLVVLPEYMNVAATAKKVKTDIEERALLLLNEQNQEIEKMQIINDTIKNVNKGIDAKLSILDFKSSIEFNSTVNVINEIQARAERIKKAELQAIEDKAAKIESERLAEAERIRIASLSKEDIEVSQKQALSLSVDLQKELGPSEPKSSHPTQNEMFEEYFKDEKFTEEPLHFIEMRVVGTTDKLMELSRFLKANQYNYKATNQGILE